MKKIFKISLADYRLVGDELHTGLFKVVGTGNFTFMEDRNYVKLSNRKDTIKNNPANKYRVYTLIKKLLDNLKIDYKILSI